ncbi:DUF5103 domain-containing protein [Paraflavitalea sp. CAU 1676]|uniref:type IX secretion system plug protein n=1 Tax=Paraflavitalea sp. CAU 1676 TaxID=3032598 RepID=UPI0023DA1A45|nr:DUF5103 domain-containing protein [Paraflavitalea sp. CAU 1676]MDF2190177.1 DUF5103 domain-containing protein [Paraflavitalea sp. CAU 1676]
MKYLFLSIFLLAVGHSFAQIPDAVYSPKIKTALLYRTGNQLTPPIIPLGATGALELHFDDLDANIKSYSYTYQLCNADWTPAILSQFDYVTGFSQQRITNYRVSSIAFTRYTHYTATLPDRNSIPSRSGNYILKVFLNGDTSKLIITKRMMVVDESSTITAQVQQPFNGQIFRTHQKIQFKVALNAKLNVVNQFQQINVVIMQNYRWDNAVTNIRPSFFARNVLEYNTENDAVFAAGKEWRWLDLRSLRFQSDRIERAKYNNTSTDVFVKPDANRSSQRFNFFKDNNGMFTIETTESVNPWWQADYANVTFTFVPGNNVPFPDKDVFIVGQLTDYNLNDSAKMVFNTEKGAYERSLFLKTGYYDYCYATIDKKDPKRKASFEFTEGNYWESENLYTILVYYRSLGGRADELVGVTTLNSRTDRPGW